MFESTKYDDSYYNAVVNNYSAGKKYNIVKWQWKYDENNKSNKETLQTYECPTIKDFNRELWDIFADFAEENTYRVIWGAFGLKNRNPEKPAEMYFDGIIFGLIGAEFRECIENQNISRFMSCLKHYGYYNIDFVVVE